MNKSILKHEIRSMKWMALLSILSSLILAIMFSISLENSYRMMFSNKMLVNEAVIQNALRNITGTAIVAFTILSTIQIFMQFKSEKGQEVGRFLKSLPVKKEEFFKIKIITGLTNLTLAFIVLSIGIIFVRNNNMFWIKDLYSISIAPERFIQADGVGSLLKEIGLIYLIVLSFYTFLFMVQYTFSNIVGGIVTGFFVWLSPAFVLISAIFTIEKFDSTSLARRLLTNGVDKYFEWFLPWIYPFQYSYNTLLVDSNGRALGEARIIENFEIKLIIAVSLILVNILLAYKLNKSSKIENENMIIPFKMTRNIFRLGVTICSGLLTPIIFDGMIGIEMHNTVYIFFLVAGGSIGYIVSKKIARVGTSQEG